MMTWILLDRLVKDFCPNGGIGMIYASDKSCGGCPLWRECVKVHDERAKRARQAAMLAKVEGRN